MNPKRRWIYITVGLLAINVLVMGVLVMASAWSPPSVVPKYYERAVAWDQSMAEARLAEELGWKIALSLSRDGVLVSAIDPAGQPVGNAHVKVTGFHRGYPAQRADLELMTDATGVARGTPSPSAAWRGTPGWYELDIAVHRGDISYSMHRELELPSEVAARQP